MATGDNIVEAPVAFGETGNYILLTATSVAVLFGLKKLIDLATSREKKQNSKTTDGAPKISEKAPRNMLEERKPSNLWNTAMFFPDYFASEPDSTTQQFLWYFSQARTSIRVCIMNCSFPEMLDVISQQYDRGLIVQYVVGCESTAEHIRLKCCKLMMLRLRIS